MRRFAIVLGLSFVTAAAVAQTLPQLAPIPAGSQPIAANQSATSFTFVVAGDNRPAHSHCMQPPQVGDIVTAVAALKPAFVLWGGDVVYGKDAKKAKAEYPDFLTAVTPAGAPIFVTPGNHELSLKGTVDCPTSNPKKTEKPIDQPDPSGKLAKEFVKAIGAPYGMFRYGNSAFVSVNTDDALDSDYQPSACEYNGFASKAQVAALEASLQALSADATVAHIFVFMHRPLHGLQSKDEIGPSSVKQIAKLRKLLTAASGKTWKYPKVSFVFASHEHLFYNYDPTGKVGQNGPFTRTDPSASGPSYLVTGGAGAPLNAHGGYYHYLTVTVDGASVTATIHRIDDTASNCTK
ncbi:MAG TPA: metallophosphoesterase [Thermoanaerobaculia bacterium]|nr:metallophosphoesterase [Thermoanaerobaculia bacterium]